MGYKLKKTMGWVIDNVSLDLDTLDKYTLQDLINENQGNFELVNLDLKYNHINLNDKLSKFVIPVCDFEGTEQYHVFIPPAQYLLWHIYGDEIDVYANSFFDNIKVKYINTAIFPYCNSFIVENSLERLTEKQIHDINFMEHMRKSNRHIPDQMIKEYSFLNFNEPLHSQIYMSCPMVITKILEKISFVDSAILKPAILLYYR